MPSNYLQGLVKRANPKSMMRNSSTFPLNPASGEGIDTHAAKNNVQGEPLNDKTPDVVSSNLNKSSEQLELRKPLTYVNIEEQGDSLTYGKIEEEGDSLYEAVSQAPTKAKNGKRSQTTSDQDKLVAPPPKKASNGSEGTPIDQSFHRSENIMKDGYYNKPLPSADHGLLYEEFPCNSGLRKSEGEDDYLAPVDEILNKGRLIADSDAATSNSTLFEKMEVGRKNLKPMAERLQAAPSDNEVYETPVENFKEDSTGRGTVSKPSSYIFSNDGEAKASEAQYVMPCLFERESPDQRPGLQGQ